MQYYTHTYTAKDSGGNVITAYPAPVTDLNGTVIGSAADKAEYINIWNSNATNRRYGFLSGAIGELGFKVISERHPGCCNIGPRLNAGTGCGCSGSTTPPPPVIAEHLTDHYAEPTQGLTTYDLPAAWLGKRIRVFRNGFKYRHWVRTTNGIALTIPGDVWEAGEELTIENY